MLAITIQLLVTNLTSKIIYLDNNGNDTNNNCIDINEPCLTWNYASNLMDNNDIILITNGSQITQTQSFSKLNGNYTIMGYLDENTNNINKISSKLIDATYNELAMFNINQSTNHTTYTIKNLEIKLTSLNSQVAHIVNNVNNTNLVASNIKFS